MPVAPHTLADKYFRENNTQKGILFELNGEDGAGYVYERGFLQKIFGYCGYKFRFAYRRDGSGGCILSVEICESRENKSFALLFKLKSIELLFLWGASVILGPSCLNYTGLPVGYQPANPKDARMPDELINAKIEEIKANTLYQSIPGMLERIAKLINDGKTDLEAFDQAGFMKQLKECGSFISKSIEYYLRLVEIEVNGVSDGGGSIGYDDLVCNKEMRLLAAFGDALRFRDLVAMAVTNGLADANNGQVAEALGLYDNQVAAMARILFSEGTYNHFLEYMKISNQYVVADQLDKIQKFEEWLLEKGSVSQPGQLGADGAASLLQGDAGSDAGSGSLSTDSVFGGEDGQGLLWSNCNLLSWAAF